MSGMYSRRFTALAGTRWVDSWELFGQTFVIWLLRKWKTLKNVLVSLVDIVSVCFALSCSMCELVYYMSE